MERRLTSVIAFAMRGNRGARRVSVAAVVSKTEEQMARNIGTVLRVGVIVSVVLVKLGAVIYYRARCRTTLYESSKAAEDSAQLEHRVRRAVCSGRGVFSSDCSSCGNPIARVLLSLVPLLPSGPTYTIIGACLL